MNTGKPVLADPSPWEVDTDDREIHVRPRHPTLGVLRAGNPFSRLGSTGLRPLDLDFHPRRFSALGIGLLIAGAVLTLAVMADYSSASDQVQHWQSQLSRLQQAPKDSPSRKPGDEAALQQSQQAAAAIDQDIKRPWEALFTAIEAAKSDDVALLSISPDAARGVVRIAGEARQREAILDYIERLGQGNVLANVVLIEDQLQQQDPDKPFRFMLSADWQRPQ